MLIRLTSGSTGKTISRNPVEFSSMDDVADDKHPDTRTVIRYADPKRYDYVRETQDEIWNMLSR